MSNAAEVIYGLLIPMPTSLLAPWWMKSSNVRFTDVIAPPALKGIGLQHQDKRHSVRQPSLCSDPTAGDTGCQILPSAETANPHRDE